MSWLSSTAIGAWTKVYGKGLEVAVFADLVAKAGFETVVVSPELDETARIATAQYDIVPLADASAIASTRIDSETACLLFFHDHDHDHDHEPELLRMLLASQAFYIGAQGSRKTATKRCKGYAPSVLTTPMSPACTGRSVSFPLLET